MNVEVKEMNKKEDRKKLKSFAILLAASFVVGIIGGIAMANLEDIAGIKDIPMLVGGALKSVSLYINLVLTIVCTVVVIILYKLARKKFVIWDGEDEQVYDDMDGKLSIALMITSVNQILLYVFMAIGFLRLIEIIELKKANSDAQGLIFDCVIFIVGIVLTLVFITVAQQKIINFTKELNPEKQGSVFDTKFQKKWIASCDEAEQKNIYEASHFAYKAVNTACMVMWFFCLFGMIVWDFGVLPVCIVCGIWLVSMISYFVKCMALQRSKYKA